MRINPLHATDFYKTGHIKQYPLGTTEVYSNFTCRGSAHATLLDDDNRVVFFGLQALCKWLLKDVWEDNFFCMSRDVIIDEYKYRMDGALGVGAVSTDHIGALWDLGYLPIEVKALPEGSLVDIRVPLFTIRSTDPEFFWVTNYLETQISSEMWKPITSATTAWQYRKLLTKYANMTGAPQDFVPWQGHDFSFRGMSGMWDAASSGAGHLLSFTGTDTISAIDFVEEFYGDNSFIGGSVPATEHSVMCMGGELNEIDTFRRLITEVYPKGIVSIVSDTWDFWKVITEYAKILKPEIMARDGKVVFRPDSGDPVKIICGDDNYIMYKNSPERKGAVECLHEIYPGPSTSKGFKTLDPHVGLIYGDSITLGRGCQITQNLYAKGFASSNIVLGIGSYTYQYVTRDCFQSAIKATFGVVNGKEREIFKKPKTDDGMKNSLCGLIRVEFENGKYVAYDRQTREQETEGCLQRVFRNGKTYNWQSISQIRGRLLSHLPKYEIGGIT